MKTHGRKLITLTVAILMVIAMMPATIHADTGTDAGIVEIGSVNDMSYWLTDAKNTDYNKVTFNLTNDIDLEGIYSLVLSGQDVTFNCNGHKLISPVYEGTGSITINGDVTSDGYGPALMVHNNVQITVNGNVTAANCPDETTPGVTGLAPAIYMTSTATVYITGDVTGTSTTAADITSGHGVLIDVAIDNTAQGGSLTVGGTVSPGNGETSGSGIYYYNIGVLPSNLDEDVSDLTGDSYVFPAVTLWKATGSPAIAVDPNVMSYGEENGSKVEALIIGDVNYMVKSPASNGKINLDKTSYKAGDTASFTVTPDSGYEVKGVSYNGTAITPVDGKYAVEVPAGGGVELTADIQAKTATPAAPGQSTGGQTPTGDTTNVLSNTSPKTGDASCMGLWALILVLAVGTVLAAHQTKKNR